MLPDRDILREVLIYRPEDGLLFWRQRGAKWFEGNERFEPDAAARMWNGRNAGKQAFSRTSIKGYKVGCIFGRQALAHRVIWKLVTGDDPDTIDHINGIKHDNRFSNLRSVSQSTNCKNKATYSNNASGVPGVTATHWNKWKVQIGNPPLYLGIFETFEEAVAVRKKAEPKRLYHPNHGRTNKE